jgi:hypothetical protein
MPEAIAATVVTTETSTQQANKTGAATAGEGGKATPASVQAGSTNGSANGNTNGASAAADTSEPASELGITEKNGKKFISMPYESFKERVAKSTKKELKALFGTSDKDALVAIKKKYDDFEKEAEERKRAEMSERQKLEADRDAAFSAKEIAERRANRMRDRVVVQKTAQLVERSAKEHVHPDKLEMVLDIFRAKVIGMSRRAADKLVGHEGDWFKDYVAKHPEFARTMSAASEAHEESKHHEKRPASNGIDPRVTGKKPSATQPSSAGGKKVSEMTRDELYAYAREKGVSLPNDMRFINPAR